MAPFIHKIQKDQVMRFIFVGVLNTIFGYLVFAVSMFLGLHYLLASGLALTISILFNFKTIGILVFNNGSNLVIIRFVLAYLLIYIVYIGLLEVFISNSVSLYIGAAILICPLAVLSFTLNKRFVFKKRVDERA